MPQTSVSTPGIGYAGMKNSHNASDLDDQYVNEGAAAIPLGYGVVIDITSGEESVRVPSGAGELAVGAVYDDQSLPSGTTSYPQYASVPVRRRGRMFVSIDVDVAVGDAVFLRHTTAGAKKAGQWGNVADGGNADAVTGARWSKGGTASDGYAEIELNLP